MTRSEHDADRHAAERGVTLLELLVALTLLGLLGGLLRDGFALGHRVWERSARGAAVLESVEGAQRFLRARLERAYPRWRAIGDTAYVSLLGDRDRLAFDAPPPDLLAPASYQRFVLERGADGGLALAWHNDTDRRPNAEPRRAVLLDNVASLELAYAGREPAAAGWRDTWREQPRLPALIRVRVTFAPGDGRIWPDLVVAPRVTVDATCAFDAVSQTCRGRL